MPEHAYNENDSRVCLSGENRYDATDFVLSIEGIIIQLVRTYVHNMSSRREQNSLMHHL